MGLEDLHAAGLLVELPLSAPRAKSRVLALRERRAGHHLRLIARFLCRDIPRAQSTSEEIRLTRQAVLAHFQSSRVPRLRDRGTPWRNRQPTPRGSSTSLRYARNHGKRHRPNKILLSAVNFFLLLQHGSQMAAGRKINRGIILCGLQNSAIASKLVMSPGAGANVSSRPGWPSRT